MSITRETTVISATADADDMVDDDTDIAAIICGFKFPKSSLQYLNAGRWANDDVIDAGLK